MNSTGKLISQARHKKALLMRELAEKLHIDSTLISRFESGKRLPQDTQLPALAEILGIQLKDLQIAWMSDRILKELKGSPFAIDALKLAEDQVKYHNEKSSALNKNSFDTELETLDELLERLQALRPINSEKIAQAFDIEYTFHSNKIEGNTLTLKETDLVVNKGLTISGKSMREHLEAINHSDAITLVRDIAEKGSLFNEKVLLQLHNLVLRGIDSRHAGKYRQVQVYISGSNFIPPQPFMVSKAMEEYFIWYELNKSNLHPVILAAELHERLVTIHPFIDGNGRTARLVMNLILLKAGYPVANIKGDAENRLKYYESLESSQMKSDKLPFLQFIIQCSKDSINSYLKVLE